MKQKTTTKEPLQPDVGSCDAAFLRYAYDAQSNTCKQFTWGGCGGNRNNFERKDECEKRCMIDFEVSKMFSGRNNRKNYSAAK